MSDPGASARLGCADCYTFKECSAKILQHLPLESTLETFKCRIDSRCGGLVELFRTQWGVETVRLMHQTPKDFIRKIEFSQYLLQNQHSVAENGYSFLLKGSLTQDSGGCEFLEFLHDQWEEQLPFRRAQRYAWHAERTTGISQHDFLDSITHDQMRIAVETFNVIYGEGLWFVDSIILFAALSGLQLYMQEKLQDSNHVIQSQKDSLLVVIVSEILDENTWSDEDGRAIFLLLLEHGEDLHSRSYSQTPLQAILSRFDNGHGIWDRIPGELIDIVDVLLSRGQNPNVLFPGARSRSLIAYPPWLCAIHVANYVLVRTLLNHNANVNALNSDGHTALDACLAHTVSTWLGQGDLATLYASTMCLLNNGGCMTEAGAAALPGFLNFLAEEDPTLDINLIARTRRLQK